MKVYILMTMYWLIAQKIDSNIRKLRSPSKVAAHAALTDNPIDPSKAEELLKDMLPNLNLNR